MDKTTVEPCKVCGSTDVNLIDGYYYCVECGTQDVNVRETIIEERALADGTFTFRQKKRVHAVLEEKKEMSPEWYKWHAYNFILEGLSNELIALGVNKSFKMKVLWLWTEYIKKYQKKEELGLSSDEQKESDEEEDHTNKQKKKKANGGLHQNIAVMQKTLIFGILYSALNLDSSEIQVSDLIRFIEEGKLDLANCEKYVPKEINVALIPGWRKFCNSSIFLKTALKSTVAILNCLSIRPCMPDLRLLVDKYMKELCLPNDFKDLVFSLMHQAPCDYLEVDKSTKLTQLPQYECVVMSYIVVAFKMCFGLDDDYDRRLSDVVDEINNDNGYLKSFKLGTFSESSDRLFSFREWCNFMQLRKIVLSKYYYHFAEKYLLDVDDYVYMEQTQTNEYPDKIRISDEVVMNLLDRIQQINTVPVIPKSEFKPTTTPFSTYTELILQYYEDPDLKLLLSEDFTQYSTKYATKNLFLQKNEDACNMITGVSKTKKEIKSEILGTLTQGTLNSEMVYVRNCDNINWKHTKQPAVEHIKKKYKRKKKKKKEERSDKDHEYDSNVEIVSSENEANSNDSTDLRGYVNNECKKELEILREEDDNVNIFDDDFEDLKEEIEIKEEKEDEQPDTIDAPINLENSNVQDFLIDNNIDDEMKSQSSDHDLNIFFNPESFDKEKTIRELVLAACKKYKAKIPDEYITKEPRKRKANFTNDKAGESSAKRCRRHVHPNKKKKTTKEEVNELLDAYYKNLQNDVLFQLSEHVKTVVSNANKSQEAGSTISLNDDKDKSFIPNDEICFDSDNHLESQENSETINVDQSASVQCIDDSERSEDEGKGDPRFDEKNYDIKQLYVEVGSESDSDDAFDIADDPEVAEIIDRKIEEIDKNKTLTLPPRQHRPKAEDFDDDIPLAVIREEKLNIHQKKNEMEKLAKMDLPHLVINRNIKKFKYWTRFYVPYFMNKLPDRNEVFHIDLNENYPKSFYFVIKECALVAQCTPFLIYRHMTRLEERIFDTM